MGEDTQKNSNSLVRLFEFYEKDGRMCLFDQHLSENHHPLF